MSETNNIPNTFQNLQVLEEARTAARLNLKSEYESVVKPFVSIIERVMKANNENHFEAVCRINTTTNMMVEPEKKIIFAAALMEIVDERNLGHFVQQKF